MPVRLVAMVLFLAAAANSAHAAPMSADDRVALQQQCTGDFTTFCPGMPSADGN